MATDMILEFGMPLKLRENLGYGDFLDRNRSIAFRRFQGKTVFLVGWCEIAFAIVSKRGDYNFEFFTGHPFDLFETASDTGEQP